MKNKLLLLLSPAVLFAATFSTITIDGDNDFSTSDEQFTTTSGSSNYWYITWDATTLYFGLTGNSGNGNATDGNRAYHIYIDTDPQLSPSARNRNEWSGISGTIPFEADFLYTFQTDANTEFKYTWNSGLSTWSSGATFNTTNFKDAVTDYYWECSIDRSDLGLAAEGAKVYVCAYVQEQWDGGTIGMGVPSTLFTNFTDDNGTHNFDAHWLGFTLTSGITPNNAVNFDQSLPVELSTFNVQNTQRGVELVWATDSEIENQGFIISRKTADSRWTEVASFSDTKALEGHGSTSQAQRYSFIDTRVREGQSYSYLLSDVDYRGNRTDHQRFVQNITFERPEERLNSRVLSQTRLYPNPFNPDITLSYDLSEASDVSVLVYSMTRELVWSQTLIDQAAGENHHLVWQGVDALGNAVDSGIYLLSIRAGSQRLTQKVTLLR